MPLPNFRPIGFVTNVALVVASLVTSRFVTAWLDVDKHRFTADDFLWSHFAIYILIAVSAYAVYRSLYELLRRRETPPNEPS